MNRFLFPLLVGSLLVNAAFALVFGLGTRAGAAPTPAVVAAPAAASSAPPALAPEIWPGLQATELPAFITRLREAGFPSEMIRALVASQLWEASAARRKALEPPLERIPFWQDRTPNPKAELALRQIYREQEKAMRDLFGDDPDSSSQVYLLQQGGRLDFLAPEKADAIRGIVRDYNDRRSDLYVAGYDREKAAALERAQRDAIARSLSPAEMFEYDLRNSRPAGELRTALASLNPTEEEFRAIFQLRQPFDEKYNYTAIGIPPPELMRQREEEEKALNTRIKALLPPERAAEYDRSTDYYYRQTSQLVARLELPAEVTVNLWNTQKEFEKRRTEIVTTAPAAERAQQLAELQKEALARVTPLLGGASRVEAYKGYGGNWLNNLAPRPPAPKG